MMIYVLVLLFVCENMHGAVGLPEPHTFKARSFLVYT